MNGVGGVVITRHHHYPDGPLSPTLSMGWQADGGRPQFLDEGEVPDLEIVDDWQLEPRDLDAVEEALCSFLRIPQAISGTLTLDQAPEVLTYPKCGGIHYIGKQGFAGKRYIIVSPTEHNQRNSVVCAVRTTSQPKKLAREFPLIEGGNARAACGELSSIRKAHVKLGSRPDPKELELGELVVVLKGIAAAWDLQDALGRLRNS